jgi:hypothetical protein
MTRRLSILLLGGALVALSGCATSSQARSVKPTGFLGEYQSLLHPGKSGEEALLIYRNPGTDWPSYKKILLEPVTIWKDPKWKLTDDEKKDLQKLVDSFQADLSQKLSADYEMVKSPGQGVMRIQAAITNTQRSNTPLKVATKAIPFPYGTGGSTVWTFITGKPPFVGEVSMEYLIKDAESGELLAASADRRVGADTILAWQNVNTEYLNSWGDVKYSLTFWTDDMVYRLCVSRGAANCVHPKEGLKLPRP